MWLTCDDLFIRAAHAGEGEAFDQSKRKRKPLDPVAALLRAWLGFTRQSTYLKGNFISYLISTFKNNSVSRETATAYSCWREPAVVRTNIKFIKP